MSSANTSRALEHVRHLAMDDPARQPLRDCGLADAGFADEQRIVFLPPAQDLDRAVDFGFAANQWIDLAVLGLLVEVDAIGLERVTFLLGFVATFGVSFFLNATHGARLSKGLAASRYRG